jgi:hypothetical protein
MKEKDMDKLLLYSVNKELDSDLEISIELKRKDNE